MPPLRILCDENIPRAIIAFFEVRHFFVERVKPGLSDKDIALQAIQKCQVILTFDFDFSNILAYPPQKYFGIVIINIRPPLLKTILRALNNFFRRYKLEKDIRGKLIILEPSRIRVWEGDRKYKKAEGMLKYQ